MNTDLAVVALTGGIASGKSLVAERLRALGAVVVDTDCIARELVEPGTPGLQAIVESFGPAVLAPSGELDRAAMRERIFSDPQARKRLDALLHPLIETEARHRLSGLDGAPYAVLVVPLLVETGLFADADSVILVDAPESDQLARLRRRDGANADSARRALAAQTSRDQRRRLAEHILDNSGSVEDLLQQVDELHRRLCKHYKPPSADPNPAASSPVP